MKTLYDLLGVAADATHSQIEHGYRESLESYIDGHGLGQSEEDTKRMRAIRDAYLLLSSPRRRRSYDKRLKKYCEQRTRLSSRSFRTKVLALSVGVLLMAGGAIVIARQLAPSLTHRAASSAPVTEAQAAPGGTMSGAATSTTDTSSSK